MTAPQIVANIAASQYLARKTRAQTIVRNGGMAASVADRHLRPWLAIACTAGASLPEIDALLADLRESEGAGPHMMSPGALRWLAAEEICPRATWAPLLTEARNQAFDRWLEVGNDTTLAAATDLQRICLALQHDVNGIHVPPYTPAAQRMQAAA